MRYSQMPKLSFLQPRPIAIGDALVVLLFCLVVRALLTGLLAGTSGSAVEEAGVALVFYALLFLCCRVHFGLNQPRLSTIVGRPPAARELLLAVVVAIVMLQYSIGEYALGALIAARFDSHAAYTLWGFRAQRPNFPPFISRPVGAYLVAYVIAGPVVEEFYFRGILTRAFASMRSWGPHVGAVLSSVVFGALHFAHHAYLSAFVMGLALSYCYLVSGSLLTGIVVHIVYNLAAFLHEDYFDTVWTRGPDHIAHLSDWLPQLGMLVMSIVAMTFAVVRVRRLLRASRLRVQLPALPA